MAGALRGAAFFTDARLFVAGALLAALFFAGALFAAGFRTGDALFFTAAFLAFLTGERFTTRPFTATLLAGAAFLAGAGLLAEAVLLAGTALAAGRLLAGRRRLVPSRAGCLAVDSE